MEIPDDMKEMIQKLAEQSSKQMHDRIIKDTVHDMKDMLARYEMQCRIDTDFCKAKEHEAGTAKGVCGDCPDQLPCALVKTELKSAELAMELKMVKVMLALRS